MMPKIPFRQQIEKNGLILIALMMVAIYWAFDVIASGQNLTRTLIALLVIVYGVFTQTLINSRKAALEEKEKAQQKLVQSEKLAAVGAVAAGVAHEVKNPLAIIVQGVAFLKNALASDERLSEVVRRVEKSVIRADNIVKGLLSFSREVPLKMEEAEIAPIIDEALSYVDDQLQSKAITVKKRYAEELPRLVMDTSQVKQVFTNLFMNAIDAMESGGILGVRAEQGRDAQDQPVVTIAVSDTGGGIPAEIIPRLFDPFFTTKTNEGNTGLGLSITKGIIDKHHGTIEIQSETGRGTRVTVGLPVGFE